MPHTDTIPVSAGIASPGFSIRYIGNWAYAYSGVIGVPNVETTLVESTSGSGIIVGRVQFAYGDQTGENFKYKVFFNDLEIMSNVTSGTTDTPTGPAFYGIIIPPFTIVKLTAENLSAVQARDQSVLLTGRVYGAE